VSLASTIEEEWRRSGYGPMLCRADLQALTRWSVRTIRRYEEDGVLTPLRPREGAHPHYRRSEVAEMFATWSGDGV